jgi:DNA-directed RNA polymerase specialized sigma24 family protein
MGNTNDKKQGAKNMNIDKTRMEYVYNNRNIREYENELITYFFDIAKHHANRLKIDYSIREDYIQETVSTAIKSIEKYSPAKNSKAFSYFYKVIYMRFLWLLRRDHNKKLRRPNISSFDLLEASVPDESYADFQYNEEQEEYIEIAGKIMPKREMVEAVKKAKKNYKKYGENYSPENSIVSLFYNQLVKSEKEKQKA